MFASNEADSTVLILITDIKYRVLFINDRIQMATTASGPHCLSEPLHYSLFGIMESEVEEKKDLKFSLNRLGELTLSRERLLSKVTQMVLPSGPLTLSPPPTY